MKRHVVSLGQLSFLFDVLYVHCVQVVVLVGRTELIGWLILTQHTASCCF